MTDGPESPPDLSWIEFETRREIPSIGFVLAPAMFMIPLLLLLYIVVTK